MPNTNHRWTENELSAVQQMEWPEFSETYPDITYNGYRFKRSALRSEGLAPVGPKSVPTGPSGRAKGFKGFTVGFLDIETTFSTQPRVLYAAIADAWGNVEQFHRNDYPGENSLFDDSELVEAIVKAAAKYDIIVTWNGKMFDIPVLNGRMAYHGRTERIKPRMHLDLMYYARGQMMRIGRSSLESVSRYFGTDNSKTPLDVRTWDRAVAGDDEAYADIVKHCDADTLVLRDVFGTLKHSVSNLHA